MRRLLLLILVVGYASLFVRMPSFGREPGRFEPLLSRGREVEFAIEQQRFADALPLVQELVRAHPDDPTIAYWHAEVLRGLGQPADEAAAWERVIELTHSADAACPPLPQAYARQGDAATSMAAYERCANLATDDPERWFDLGSAYLAAGRQADATRAFDQARQLDPTNPRLPTRALLPDRQTSPSREVRP